MLLAAMVDLLLIRQLNNTGMLYIGCSDIHFSHHVILARRLPFNRFSKQTEPFLVAIPESPAGSSSSFLLSCVHRASCIVIFI